MLSYQETQWQYYEDGSASLLSPVLSLIFLLQNLHWRLVDSYGVIILDVIDSTSVGCYSIINKSHSQIYFFYWFVLDSQLLALYKQNFKGQRKYNQKSLTNQKRYSLLHINESWRDWLLAKETQLHNIRSKDWLSGSQVI